MTLRIRRKTDNPGTAGTELSFPDGTYLLLDLTSVTDGGTSFKIYNPNALSIGFVDRHGMEVSLTRLNIEFTVPANKVIDKSMMFHIPKFNTRVNLGPYQTEDAAVLIFDSPKEVSILRMDAIHTERKHAMEYAI